MNQNTSTSTTPVGGTNPNSAGRELALQFVYQCEAQKLFHFMPAQFEAFAAHMNASSKEQAFAARAAAGVLERLEEIDNWVGENSKNWKLSRMAATDRTVLRLAAWELLEGVTPPKVVLNEAIELAKRYGTEESGAFVNGLLDALLRSRAQQNKV